MNTRVGQARHALTRGRMCVVAAALLSAAGCAGQATSAIPAETATAGPPVPVPGRTMRPRPPTGAPPTLLRAALTVADNGATVLARPGRPLTVTLAPDVGNWERPRVGGAGVLRLDAVTGGYPSHQALVARFSVIGHGLSDITTFTDLACLHARPACKPPQQEWHVRVVVR